MDTNLSRVKNHLPNFIITDFIKSRKFQAKSHVLQEPNTLKLPGFSITSGNWDRQISTAKSHACLPGKKGGRTFITSVKSISALQHISA